MQKHNEDGVTIHCDFCGKAWDMLEPMIEGHHGSVLCLECLDKAVDFSEPAKEDFKCSLCLRDFEAGAEKVYRPDPLPEGANPAGRLCFDCVRQADRAFAKDPETAWERRIEPDKRWR